MTTRRQYPSTTRRVFLPALLLLGCATMPALAIVARPATPVGAPISVATPQCLSIATPGGKTLGIGVPIAGLALGAPVKRNAISFMTGGGGTSNAAIEAQRRAAGLQWQPKIFDPAGKERPSVYAAEPGQPLGGEVYQRLLLKPSRATALPYGLIYARAVSASTGRIVSIGLNLAAKPAAQPRVTISSNHARRAACPNFAPVDVYAPNLSAAQIEHLFTNAQCSWSHRNGCDAAYQPRGQVLFVQRQGLGYELRWVDYDLLLGK